MITVAFVFFCHLYGPLIFGMCLANCHVWHIASKLSFGSKIRSSIMISSVSLALSHGYHV